ncbi:MAG: alkyl hydroperoxide reductase [Ferruginibacter sp.]|nr:alkyl hydroperoxide reductase [Ferruginibacter sp.]
MNGPVLSDGIFFCDRSLAMVRDTQTSLYIAMVRGTRTSLFAMARVSRTILSLYLRMPQRRFILIIGFIVCFLGSCGIAKAQYGVDSLELLQWKEMAAFYRNLEIKNLPEEQLREQQYQHLKTFLTAYPANNSGAFFIDWSKSITALQADTLSRLVAPAVRNKYSEMLSFTKQRLQLTENGQPFPKLVLRDSSGKEADIASLKGKIVLLDVWSSWCGPCRREIPELKKLYQKYKDSGFVVIGISLDDNKNKWVQAMQHDGQTWPAYCELKPWRDNTMYKRFKITAIPDNFLIGRDGKLYAQQVAMHNLENKIRRLL